MRLFRQIAHTTMRRCAAVVSVALVSVVVAAAAPLERDLGDGLVYFRVHHLPTDLPSDQMLRHRPCVLDLRFATGDAAAGQVLESWVKFHASAKTPVLVLINAATAAPLQNAFAFRENTPGLLTIGLSGQKFEPDIAVSDSAANEEKAYHALESGSSVALLTTDHPEKQRNDEASLSHDRPSDSGEDGPSRGKAKAGAPAIDAVLQRAIQIHRALRAMKKL